MRVGSVLVAMAIVACGSNDTSSTASGGGAGKGGTNASGGGPSGGTFPGGTGGSAGLPTDSGSDAAAPAPVVEVIHEHHRYIAGSMFGGWGPHLGHLLRAPASSGGAQTLWLADDYCTQDSSASACDVLHDHTLGYFERTASGWIERATIALPGTVQQNTGSILSADGKKLETFGLDVAGHAIVECDYDPTTGPLGCNALPFTLDANSNYMGAAISPQGYRVVWWTGVVDGGGGSFSYIVDYGGGWNGPRSGDVGGYNDASYANIAFGGTSASEFTLHVELVSGLEPNWSFLGGVGYGDLSTTDPVTWANALSVAGDTVASTNDIWTDPATGDTHLFATTSSGAAPYFHRPAGGAWSGATFSLNATHRARFVVSGDRLILIYGPNEGGLAYRIAEKSDRVLGVPIAWDKLIETSISLPSDFGVVQAIYPESPAYQTTPGSGIHVAIVGATKQWSVTHVGVD